ncbi:helix-turn-helix domain-containing protein [Microvirga thermotolerans]|uniref:Helix-turn-helix domain-containing protein n=1 Tax=Microvirga thermotolerans TaxID=2651334 RepID=A0A5P9JZB5_9HYPH|nr:helix-turn-helix domain-containing protein [Microvirga thermotolerans]QFU16976.1 helix-turn-helix domain-containing protein [Microvirga thermotolerans]
MDTIPTYALYGEYKDDPGTEWIHGETIQSRSRLHDYVIEPHRHERLFQILHLAGGEADFVQDGQRSRLVAPCIVTLPPMTVHGYTFTPDVEGTVLTLFEHRLGAVLAAAAEIVPTFRAVHAVAMERGSPDARTVSDHVAAIAAELSGRRPGRLGAVEAHLALLLIALHRLQGAAKEAAPNARNRALDHLMRFRRLVDEEFRSHKPVEAYARRLGLTASHLNRLCREHLGETALDVIHGRLALEARRYLTFTSLSAKEVALALAFEDPAYFTRFFKRRTGLTPTGFRALRNGETNP